MECDIGLYLDWVFGWCAVSAFCWDMGMSAEGVLWSSFFARLLFNSLE